MCIVSGNVQGLDRTMVRAKRAMVKAMRAVEETLVTADAFCDILTMVIATSGSLKSQAS